MGLGLTLVEGLSGELSPPKAYRRVPTADGNTGKGSKLAENRASSDGSILAEYGKFFQREHPWEIFSMCASAFVALLCAALYASGVNSYGWLAAWLALVIVLLPLQLVALYKVVQTHSAHMKEVRLKTLEINHMPADEARTAPPARAVSGSL